MKKYSNIFKVLFIALFTFAFAWSMSCGGAASVLVSIAVTPASSSIVAGATQQFTATGLYADSSTADLTATVTWVSSDTAVADFVTADTAGLATGVAAGTATITASAEGGLSGSTDLTVATASGTITALYTNGTNWNDYIANDGTDIFTASDTVCNAATAGPGYDACLNGGIFRAVEVTGRGVCDGLTASDSLGLFTWVCDSNTNDVRMVAVGFAAGMGLSDLVDFDTAAWKQLSVTVLSDGNPYLVTDTAALFTNTIVVNNTGADVNANEVQIVTSNGNAQYTIRGDSATLLIKPGLTIDWLASINNNVIEVIGRNFAWIEGAVDGTGHNNTIHLSDAKFCVVKNASLKDANSAGLNVIAASNNNYFDGIMIAGGNLTGNGVNIANSTGNALNNIFVTNTNSEGIYVQANSSGNIINNATIANCATGFNSDASGNTFVNITILSPEAEGCLVLQGDNAVMNSTIVNGNDEGFYLSNNSNLVRNTTVINVANRGFRITGTDGNTYENIVSTQVAGNDVDLNVSSNNYFTGLLKVGSNAASDCVVVGGTNPGIDDSCNPVPPSDFTKATSTDLTNSFIAAASSDSVNADGATGADLYANITDWVNFENAFRGWGYDDGSAFPAVTQRRRCTTLNNTCQIWDWSMASADTVVRDVLALPTGDDTITHTWTDASTTTFLRNAVEIMFDYIGNENGLCESNETCLYTPNIGSYQGHGNLVSAGDFTDGTITGVTLMQYETNGR